MNKSKAIVPGSFDPITLGHMDIIKRAASIFDTVYVIAFINSNKSPRFSENQKLEMIKAACSSVENVRCGFDSGMLADFCLDHEINIIVKGVRNASDYSYEAAMAEFNRNRNPDLDTLLLPSEAGMSGISSSAVYERLIMGMPVDKMVPPEIIPLLSEYIKH